jgi:hypothetical protein
MSNILYSSNILVNVGSGAPVLYVVIDLGTIQVTSTDAGQTLGYWNAAGVSTGRYILYIHTMADDDNQQSWRRFGPRTSVWIGLN